MTDTRTFFKKITSINFTVKNLSNVRRIKIFNYPIEPGKIRDLLSIPEISEDDIRHSLIKGELQNFIKMGILQIVSSSIDLTQYDPQQQQLLMSAGFVPPPPLVVGGSGAEGVYSCTANVSLLDVVYLMGENKVDQSFNTNDDFQPVVGLVSAKITDTVATVRYNGEITGFSGLIPRQRYYLGPDPGGITPDAPQNPGDVLQKIGFAKNTTTLIISIDLDFTVL